MFNFKIINRPLLCLYHWQKGKVTSENMTTTIVDQYSTMEAKFSHISTMASFVEFFQKGRTFRPKKKFEPGTLRYSLHKHAHASLNSGINLVEVVKLPPRENLSDWIAVHVVDFFNRINLIYGTITDHCTEETCPRMSGGPKFEYLWADGKKFKKPTPQPAPKYVGFLMDWTEAQINNEDIFPVKTDVPFPKNFIPTSIGAEAHVNTCYKHFYYFVTEFDLVSEKEFEPLTELTRRICHLSSPRTYGNHQR
ncbi:MOB kinase activator-like 3 isoform X2 [Panonychus citri]|uniref:MOB kinase activator-like 3 isoform X2 n=1 Tax=Panonychus citri TaxID=50023 RepID=UPI002307C13D|nr:MOB kinase activator-like 3 isoform X2 [Panonychus citri]